MNHLPEVKKLEMVETLRAVLHKVSIWMRKNSKCSLSNVTGTER